MPKQLTTIRLSEPALKNIEAIRKTTGVESQSAIIEMALAALAKGLTMNNNTIKTKFDKSILPDWAQANEDVVAICKKDLSFRANVIAADTDEIKNMLIRDAKWRNERGQ